MANSYSQSLWSLLILLSFLALPSQGQQPSPTFFKCSKAGTKCEAIAGYKTPNTTTITNIAKLFGIKDHNSILSPNNLSLSTPQSHTFKANSTIRVPFTCSCSAKGNGVSDNRLPLYKVKPQDTLYKISTEVFSGLLTSTDIANANNIPDPNKIDVGQEFWIPLPCSCDDVDGKKVVHYTHVVEPGSSLDAIAKEFRVDEDELKKLNDIFPPKILLAGQPLDVPLPAAAEAPATNNKTSEAPAPNNKASKSGLQNFSWISLFISVHMVWLCFYLFE